MEVDAKIKELEDEFKVLKAEIRNVLLDIREVILERTNPLADEHETAFIRMDLKTTARAMASEAAAKEMSKATDEATHAEAEAAEDEQAPAESPEDEETAMPEGVHVVSAEEIEADTDATTEEEEAAEASEVTDSAETDEPEEQTAPKVVKRQLRPTNGRDLEPEAPLPTEIPPMYQANMLPLSGTITISEWLTEALSTVGPKELERIIAIHRLWGNMPPNISRALAYLQELLSSCEESDPPWLKVMQDLDQLAAL